MRLQFARFSEEACSHVYTSSNRAHDSFQNIQKNLKIVDELKAIAEQKKITAAQLSLAWVGSLGSHVIVIPGSSYVFCRLFFLAHT
jgi:aryl-alcohol dehydrogenase-like predicted oxidoreductase